MKSRFYARPTRYISVPLPVLFLFLLLLFFFFNSHPYSQNSSSSPSQPQQAKAVSTSSIASAMKDIAEECAMNYGNAMQYECLLFDLDDTLYPLSSGIAAACRTNIEDYIVTKLGVEAETASELCLELYRTYGTTLAGLVAKGYKIDFDDYHNFVHGRLPYHVLRADPVLRSLLLSMPQRKWVFTNSDQKHAHIVLRRLGLEDCFEGVICFETITYGSHSLGDKLRQQVGYDQDSEVTVTPVICKPSLEAIKHALNICGANPSKTLFFDDSTRNIAAGKTVGLHTVLVGHAPRIEEADYAIESIHNIREAVPHIWEEDVAFLNTEIYREEIVVAA